MPTRVLCAILVLAAPGGQAEKGKHHRTEGVEKLISNCDIQKLIHLPSLGEEGVVEGYNILKAGFRMDVEALFPQMSWIRTRRLSPKIVGDQLKTVKGKSIFMKQKAS